MSDGTREIVRICEQLPEAKRLQVEHYARSLLAREPVSTAAFNQWLDLAEGTATEQVTTDEVMAMTRGEP